MDRDRLTELSFLGTIAFALLALFALLLVGLWLGSAVTIVAALVACGAAYAAQLGDTFAAYHPEGELSDRWFAFAQVMWVVSMLAWIAGLTALFF